MFTTGGVFMCGQAAGYVSLEQSVMTTEGFACWLSKLALLCCRDADPDTLPAYFEDVSCACQGWSCGDVNNDTVVSCSARSNSQTRQYSCWTMSPT